MFENIKIGNRAEISLERGGKRINTYTTKVEIIDSKDEVFIGFPVSLGQYVKLPKIKSYTIIFYTDLGLFEFKAGVEKYVKIDGLPFIKIQLLDDGVKVQRREYFRYECLKEFEFCILNDKDSFEEYGEDLKEIKDDSLTGEITEEITEEGMEEIIDETFIGISKDIGAGGIRFITGEDINKDDTIRVFYEIYDYVIMADAIILDRSDVPEQQGKYQVRCMFTNITEEDKEKIISFIFNEQRKRMRIK